MSLKAGSSACICPTCDLRFKSVSAFDKHRVGSYAGANTPNTRRCLTPEEMTALGMILGPRGWITQAYTDFRTASAAPEEE